MWDAYAFVDWKLNVMLVIKVVSTEKHTVRHQVTIMTAKDLGQLSSLSRGVQFHLISYTYLCLLQLLIQKGMDLHKCCQY